MPLISVILFFKHRAVLPTGSENGLENEKNGLIEDQLR